MDSNTSPRSRAAKSSENANDSGRRGFIQFNGVGAGNGIRTPTYSGDILRRGRMDLVFVQTVGTLNLIDWGRPVSNRNVQNAEL